MSTELVVCAELRILMTPERFQLISQIYHDALKRPEMDREFFIEQRCGSDEELRREVAHLLSGGKEAEAELLSRAMKESVRRLSDETPLSLLDRRWIITRLCR